jgi:HSP20 family protein
METNTQGNGQRSEKSRSPGSDLPESQGRNEGRAVQQPPAPNRRAPSSGFPRRANNDLVGWNASPFDSMLRLSREMDQLISSFFGNRFVTRSDDMSSLWSPQIDVRRKGDSIVIHAELAGIAKDAIQIEATEEGIAISGERRETREEGAKDSDYHLSERSFGSFYRNIPLPDGAQVEEAKANMRDGVLEITVPFRPTQARKRIDISN